jgi:hypothetical protein
VWQSVVLHTEKTQDFVGAVPPRVPVYSISRLRSGRESGNVGYRSSSSTLGLGSRPDGARDVAERGGGGAATGSSVMR